MKTLKMILALTLLLSVSSMAMTSKVKEPTKIVYEVLEGTTVGQVSKTGVAVDIAYKTQHVDVGESSDVNITISTTLSEGMLKVNLRGLEDDITGVDTSNHEFTLSKNKNSFPINLQLSSSTEGIHYLNVSVTVEGQGTRVLAVPLNVGTVSKSMKNQMNTTNSEGKVISISSAEEEIK